jgi:hypothetical protein
MSEKRFFMISAVMTLVFGAMMFFFYIRAISYEENVTLRKQMDSLLMTLRNKLNESSNIALASSLMLSKNPYVIDCLSKNDKKLCFNYMLEIESVMLQQPIFKNMGIHLHTKEYKSFMRLWSYENQTEDNLATFRHSLVKARNAKKPVQGIEIGRYGMLERSITPIFDKDIYIGSIETVVFPEEYTRFFSNMNIDLYILLKNEYLPTVTAIDYPKKMILKNYTITNQDTNGINFINNLEFFGTGYLKNGDKYVLYTPITDINGEEVGYYLLSWSESLSNACKINCATLKIQESK